MSFALTGDVCLLRRAELGVRWRLDHAVDAHGGCHAQLRADGTPIDGAKTAHQDLSYCMLGLAAWYFVTRDAEAEVALLSARDLLFA